MLWCARNCGWQGWYGKGLALFMAAALPYAAAQAQARSIIRSGVARPAARGEAEGRFLVPVTASPAATEPAAEQAEADPVTSRRDQRGQSQALVTAASAIIPGAGQALMRQRRSLMYLSLEAIGVGFYVRQLRDGSRQRDRYRELSRTIARAAYSPAGPQGSWDYYERMEKFVESGAFDAVAGGAVDPETNPDSYNGSVWLLARQNFWRDPDVPPPAESEEYIAALRFYTQRAIGEEFRWSWLGEPDGYGRYRAAIAGSNSAFRNAEQTASLIIANHFLSAVDAYVSIHIRVRRHSDGSLWLSGSMPAAF